MSQDTSVESDMTFQYDSDDMFLPERSSIYKSLVKQDGIKSCDFVWYHNEKLFFIEVKATAPDNKNPNLTKYIQEIHLKLIHTLLMFLGMHCGRPFREETILPSNISSVNVAEIAIVPVLIVRQHQKDWIPSLADTIRKHIKGTKKAYCLDDIIVLNEESARKKRFII